MLSPWSSVLPARHCPGSCWLVSKSIGPQKPALEVRAPPIPSIRAFPFFRLRGMQTSTCCPGLGALDVAPAAAALHRAVETQVPETVTGSEVTPGLSAVAGFSVWP